MPPIAFALSVHRFVTSVGAYVAFGVLVGFALLVLLYFAHARETSLLRDHADELADRVAELEARVSSLVRAAATAASRAAPAAGAGAAPASVSLAGRGLAGPLGPGEVTVADIRSARPSIPAAPAGVGAPALAAATRLIPLPVPVLATAAGEAPLAVGASREAAEPAAVAAATGAGRTVTAARPGAPSGPPPVAPPGPPPVAPSPPLPAEPIPVAAEPLARPATVAGGANGTSGRRFIPPSAMPSARAAAASSRSRPSRDRSAARAGRLVVPLAAALVVAAVVVLLLVLTSGGGGSHQAASSTPTSGAPAAHHAARPATLTPASVTVAVLNGTAISGLAHRVALELGADGYREGTVATATDQTRTATVVAFMPGHRRDALAVARKLKLGSASVQPIDPATQAVACPPSTACTANVVVTVGTDLSATAG